MLSLLNLLIAESVRHLSHPENSGNFVVWRAFAHQTTKLPFVPPFLGRGVRGDGAKKKYPYALLIKKTLN
jgi:hypothetical protein